jgi:hypothetical protein
MRRELFILIFCSVRIWGQNPVTDTLAKAPDEKPAIELGGIVTLDYWADAAALDKPELTLGLVELGANVFVSDEVTATVVISAWNKLDSIWIDQAMASWKPAGVPFEFFAGQHTLYHGLGTTRLINFPDIYNAAIMKKPAITALYRAKSVCVGLAPTVLSFDFDSIRTTAYACVVHGEVALPNESVIRLASLLSKDMVDVDLASGVTVGPLSFDVEALAHWGLTDNVSDESGYYAGIAWSPFDRLTLAVRNDGFSEGIFADMTQRFTGGLTLTIKDDIFCAFEYSYVKPKAADPGQQIALEVGLASSLKLPGFRPKSLVNPE